jgi:hypothetical protein
MATEEAGGERRSGPPSATAMKPGGPLRPSPGPSEAASALPAPDTSRQAGLFRDRILLLLVNGMSVEAAEGYCLQQGMDLETAKRLVAEARQRITVAADYTREEQLGLAVRRLEDLYSKSIAAKDTRTALQAQREINRLLGLYAPKSPAAEEPAGGSDDGARRLALIDQYLRPLELTDDRYPTEEHARVAAELLRARGL